jgi:hypothetical protein
MAGAVSTVTTRKIPDKTHIMSRGLVWGKFVPQGIKILLCILFTAALGLLNTLCRRAGVCFPRTEEL